MCDSVSRPVNVLAFGGLSFAEIAEAGRAARERRRRAHLGGGLARSRRRRSAIRDGDFSSLEVRIPLREWFSQG